MDHDEREMTATAGGARGAAAPAAAARPALRGSRLARAASITLLAAAVQFVLLTALAMTLYPGGSAHDPAAEGYSFTHNFFSDLGATATESGAANPVDHAIFTYALVCIGVTLAGFGFAVRSLAGDWGRRSGSGERGGRARSAVTALAPVSATMSGVGFVAVALVPEDVSGSWHKHFVNLAFGLLLVFVLCLFTLELKAGWGLPLTVPNAAYVVLLAAYVFLLFWGPSTATVRGLVIQVVAQKIIVYASILNLGWQALGFVRHLRPA